MERSLTSLPAMRLFALHADFSWCRRGVCLPGLSEPRSRRKSYLTRPLDSILALTRREGVRVGAAIDTRPFRFKGRLRRVSDPEGP